jgi:hypothetical protein
MNPTRSRRSRSLTVLVGLLLAASPDPVHAEPPASATAVPWTQVRDAIGETMCGDVLVSGEKTVVDVIVRDRARCSSGEPTPLRRAVDRAIEDAGFVLVSMSIDAPHTDTSTNPEAATRAVRSYYLGSPAYLRPILLRLPAELAKEGLACSGCPDPQAVPIRSVGWNQFFPYLAAQVWPDRVKTPRGPDGAPAGRPRYSFHICSGLNGLSEMKEPDLVLARAAFVSAIMNSTVTQQTGKHFEAVLAEDAFKALADDDAKTAYLRRRIREELARDETVKAAVCERLLQRRDDLGLEVDGCGGPATTPADPHVAANAPQDQPRGIVSAQRQAFLDAVEPYVKQARSTYPAAKAKYLAGLPPHESFFVVTRLVDDAGRMEQVFVVVDRIEAGVVEGRIWSELNVVRGYRLRDPIRVQESDLVDWVITKPDGTEEGNFVGKFLDSYDPGQPK